ncbi:cysteine desulfurase [Gemmatimonadetes bacterium T265]|nr:cysteine desulfurase [Gemmatimonadetes bacterium T265]
MHPPVYLDHAATTPVRPEVLEAMQPFFGGVFGNPSSTHGAGRRARAALDDARARMAHCLGAEPDEICFTSGGTEADNFAVLGAWRAGAADGRAAVVTTPIEHKAVLAAGGQAAREGGELRVAQVDPDGTVDAASMCGLLGRDVAVCSIMAVNNETGVVQPVLDVAERARAYGIPVHVDAVQGFGTLDFDVRALPVDLLSVSGHKFGAPKGVGVLYVRRGTRLAPLLHGGGQDGGRRPGTENVAFAVGMAVAAEQTLRERSASALRLRVLRDAFEARLLARLPTLVVHGRNTCRAPHISSVAVPGVPGRVVLDGLDARGIYVSGGSACQSTSAAPSHVLLAMTRSPALAGNSIRVSLGHTTTHAEVQRAASAFVALMDEALGADDVRVETFDDARAAAAV